MEKNRTRNGKGQEGQGEQRPKPTKEERIAKRVELAQDEAYAFVPRRALETSDMVVMVSKNDYLVNRLRTRIGTDERIDGEKAVALLKNNLNLREMMNRQNAELSKVLGLDYVPPRGYRNPLAKPEAVKEKKTGKEPAPLPVERQEVAITA